MTAERKPEVSKADEKIANAVVDAHRNSPTDLLLAGAQDALAALEAEHARLVEERDKAMSSLDGIFFSTPFTGYRHRRINGMVCVIVGHSEMKDQWYFACGDMERRRYHLNTGEFMEEPVTLPRTTLVTCIGCLAAEVK